MTTSATKHSAVTPRLWQAASLLGTLGILAAVPTNAAKLVALVVLWVATFRPRLSAREALSFAFLSALFFALNARALACGVFAFAAPDVLGMPCWELVMWGYYVTWTRRVVGGPPPPPRPRRAIPFALVFALPFGLPIDHATRFAASAALLAVGLLLFHQGRDLAMVVMMMLVGAAVEYGGVALGLWHYPGEAAGAVPPWFATMWGGVGLLARQLLPSLEAAVLRRWPGLTAGRRLEEEVG